MVLKTISWKRLFLAAPLVFALLITTTTSVYARPVYYGDSIPAGTVVQSDVVLTGNNVVIDGTVVGDVLVIGNHIRINGTIEGSLIAAGQTIRINGKVKGTTYSAAMAIELGTTANLNRNLYFGGLSFASRKGALVNRDLTAFSLGGTILGEIKGNVKAVIGPYEILKLIFDALKVEIQLPGMIYDEPNQLETTPETPATPQPMSYRGGKTALTQPGRSLVVLNIPVMSNASNQEEAVTLNGIPIDWPLIGAWFLGRLRSLIVLAIFSLISMWLIPKVFTSASEKLRSKPLPSLGTGLVGFFVSFNIILAAILVGAVLTAIGFWLVFATVWELGVFIWSAGLGMVLLFITLMVLFSLYTTKAIAAYTLGYIILKPLSLRAAQIKPLPLLLGLVLYVLLAGLPYVGWLISLLAIVFGLGSFWLDYRQSKRIVIRPKLKRAQAGNNSQHKKPVRKAVAGVKRN